MTLCSWPGAHSILLTPAIVLLKLCEVTAGEDQPAGYWKALVSHGNSDSSRESSCSTTATHRVRIPQISHCSVLQSVSEGVQLNHYLYCDIMPMHLMSIVSIMRSVAW